MLYVEIVHGSTTIGITDIIPAAGSPVPVRPAVLALDEFVFSMNSAHGGMIGSEYGNLTLRPNFFAEMAVADSAWWPPPPALYRITVRWYPDDGSAAWDVPCVLVGWLEGWDNREVVYSLRTRDTLATTVRDAEYDGTLATVFTAACSTLGLTLDASMARSPSPLIKWTASGERRIIDNLDDMARYCCHAFRIDGTTLTLAQVVGTKPSTSGWRPDEYIECRYLRSQPVARLTAPYKPPYIRKVQLRIDAVANSYGVACLTEFRITRSAGGDPTSPDAVAATASDPSHPASHTQDANLATYWSSDASAVPGVIFGAVVADGSIAEYVLTGYSVPDYSPAQWRLYAYHDFAGRYEYLETVTAEEWEANEVRRFRVGTPTWQVIRTVAHTAGGVDYALGDDLAVQPCHDDYYFIGLALAAIEPVVTAKRVRLVLPIRNILPWQMILFNDNLGVAGKTVEAWMKVDSTTYDFSAATMVVEGYGGWE